jgi:AcrR family transcriptional regulator
LRRVAREAGVSKGGLIHHFPSKDALVAAMAERASAEMAARIEAALALEEESDLPGRYTRAYIRANLSPANESDNAFVLHLFELFAVKPDAFTGALAHFEEINQRIEHDGLDPVLAAILTSASDACWLEVLFGLATPGSERLSKIGQRLIEMSYGEAQPPKRGARGRGAVQSRARKTRPNRK